jgi:hypothetical protein
MSEKRARDREERRGGIVMAYPNLCSLGLVFPQLISNPNLIYSTSATTNT